MKQVALPEIEFIEADRRLRPYHRSTDLLSVACLEIHYGSRHAVRQVSISVRSGEVVGLIGHNGCGKSSTLRAIFGLTRPTSGEVMFDGTDLALTGRVANGIGIGFVPEAGAVFAALSVRDNLRLGAGPKTPDEVVARRLGDVLSLFGDLGDRLDTAAGRLSAGQQRRLSIALALMGEPRLLILDEPTKHLSPSVVGEILGMIRRLADERRLGVLLAEVNVASTVTIADRVYVMNNGAICSEHTGPELFAAGRTSWWKLF